MLQRVALTHILYNYSVGSVIFKNMDHVMLSVAMMMIKLGKRRKEVVVKMMKNREDKEEETGNLQCCCCIFFCVVCLMASRVIWFV